MITAQTTGQEDFSFLELLVNQGKDSHANPEYSAALQQVAEKYGSVAAFAEAAGKSGRPGTVPSPIPTPVTAALPAGGGVSSDSTLMERFISGAGTPEELIQMINGPSARTAPVPTEAFPQAPGAPPVAGNPFQSIPMPTSPPAPFNSGTPSTVPGTANLAGPRPRGTLNPQPTTGAESASIQTEINKLLEGIGDPEAVRRDKESRSAIAGREGEDAEVNIGVQDPDETSATVSLPEEGVDPEEDPGDFSGEEIPRLEDVQRALEKAGPSKIPDAVKGLSVGQLATPGQAAGVPPKNQQEFEEKRSGWMGFLSKPEVRAALLQAGIMLTQPRAPGQTKLGHFGQALAAGAGAAGRVVSGKKKEKAAEVEASRKQQETDIRKEAVGVGKTKNALTEKRDEQQAKTDKRKLDQEAKKIKNTEARNKILDKIKANSADTAKMKIIKDALVASNLDGELDLAAFDKALSAAGLPPLFTGPLDQIPVAALRRALANPQARANLVSRVGEEVVAAKEAELKAGN